ncbi:MAG: peptidylprolyl isomerase [Pseudomonadota bacterium]
MHLKTRLIGSAFLGAALVSAISACSSEPDARPAAAEIEGSVAAIVNGDPIYFEDIELEAVAQGQIEPGTDFGTTHPEYHQILEQLIDQRLLAQEAVNRGLDLEPDAQRRLASGRERLLGNILVESLVANEVTEAAIDRMYDEQVKLQQLDDEVRVRLILVETEDEADRIAASLEGGMSFTEAALQYSTDARTRLEGGDLGWLSPNELDDPLPAIIGDTETGSISPVFQTADGWTLIKVDERRTSPPKTKAEMRPEIITFLTFTQISDILRELRVAADIQKTEPIDLLDQTAPEADTTDTE